MSDRPATLSEMLTILAAYLDATDAALGMTGSTVQSDLRALATALDRYPEVATFIYSVAFND